MKRELRDAARRLRCDDGLALNAIAARLGVSKSSVSRWVRDIELWPDQHAALREPNPIDNAQLRGQGQRREAARAARLAAQEHGRAYARRRESLHVQGCMLYWAEGAKCRNAVIFVNSDADMVELFLRFVQRGYDVPVEAVPCRSTATSTAVATLRRSPTGGCGVWLCPRRALARPP